MTAIRRKWLAVLGLLAVALMVGILISKPIVYQKEDRLRVQLEMISDALLDYARQNGKLPGNDEGLSSLVASKRLNSDALLDPWGGILAYDCPGACVSATVKSSGPNRTDDRGRFDDLAIVVTPKKEVPAPGK